MLRAPKAARVAALVTRRFMGLEDTAPLLVLDDTMTGLEHHIHVDGNARRSDCPVIRQRRRKTASRKRLGISLVLKAASF